MVHVGANYIPRPFNRHTLSPDLVAYEINALLDAVKGLFATSVTFSCIIPQRNLAVIDIINMINTLVSEHCFHNGIGLLQCFSFQRRMGKLDDSLLACDGTHLSRKGVDAMFVCLTEHLIYEHLIDNYDN